MPKYRSSERHPFESLIILILLAVAGAVFFTLLAFITGALVFGSTIFQNLNETLQGKDDAGLGLLKIVQIFSTIGTFIVPALVFARTQSPYPLSYLKINTAPFLLVILAAGLVIVSDPFLEWTIQLNRQMKLPGILKSLEDWMRSQEDQMDDLTQKLLIMKTPAALMVNLLMIAILPAIGEEFIFRGGMQQIFTRWTKNHHIAIWLTAIIFSSIHMQFYGFIPRMLLGALLGYLFVWGKSIWLPVTAHFVNNAISVAAAYIYQLKGQSLTKLNEPGQAGLYMYTGSLALTIFFLLLYYRFSQINNQQEHIDTDGKRLG